MPQLIFPDYKTPTHRFIEADPTNPNAQPNAVVRPVKAYKDLPTGTFQLVTGLDIDLPDTVKEIIVQETYVGVGGKYTKILYNGESRYIFTGTGGNRNIQILPSLNKKELTPLLAQGDLGDYKIPSYNSWWQKQYDRVYVEGPNSPNYAVVALDFQDTGGEEEVIRRAELALIKGARLLLKESGHSSSEAYVKRLLKENFEFIKVTDYIIPPRPCGYLLFLVVARQCFLGSADLSSPTAEELSLEGEDFGAGSINRIAQPIISFDFNTFDNFRKDIITKYFDLINYYGKVQEDFFDEYLRATNFFVSKEELKKLAQLNLTDESTKFIDSKDTNFEVQIYSDFDIKASNFLSVLKYIFLVNNVDISTPSNFRLFLGFDEFFNICHVKLMRNNIEIPLKRYSGGVFLDPLGSGGLAGSRAGFLLWSIHLRLLSTERNNRPIKDDTLNEFIDRHIIPTPPLIELPSGTDENCIKDSIQKIFNDARIIANQVDSINYVIKSAQSGSLAKELGLETANNVNNSAAGAYGATGAILASTYGSGGAAGVKDAVEVMIQDLKEAHRKEHFQKLIQNIIICMIRGIDPAQLQGLLADFKEVSEFIRTALREVFCNPTLIKVLDAIGKFPQFPKFRQVDIQEALKAEIRKQITKIVLELYMAAINELIALAAQCQTSDPNSPFGAADNLGINGALDDFLRNLTPDNNAAVNDLYDTIGAPSATDANPNRINDDIKNDLANLVKDVTCVLTTIEVCNLFIEGGQVSQEVLGLVKNVINVNYPGILDTLKTDEEIINFFRVFGGVINIQEACRTYNFVAQEAGIQPIVCLAPAADAAARLALTNGQTTPEQVKAIIDDIKKKRLNRIQDLLDKLSNIGPDTQPLLCRIDENGNPVPGAINLAKSDPSYNKMVEDMVAYSLNPIVNIFRQEGKVFARFFEERSSFPGVSDEVIIDAMNIPDQKERRKRLLELGILERKAKDYADFIERRDEYIDDKDDYDDLRDLSGEDLKKKASEKALIDIEEDDEEAVDYISNSQPNLDKTLEAPTICSNVSNNLAKDAPRPHRVISLDGTTHIFNIDSSEARTKFLQTSIANVQFGKQNQIAQILEKALLDISVYGVNQFLEAIRNAIIQASSGQVELHSASDYAKFLFGFQDTDPWYYEIVNILLILPRLLESLSGFYQAPITSQAAIVSASVPAIPLYTQGSPNVVEPGSSVIIGGNKQGYASSKKQVPSPREQVTRNPQQPDAQFVAQGISGRGTVTVRAEKPKYEGAEYQYYFSEGKLNVKEIATGKIYQPIVDEATSQIFKNELEKAKTSAEKGETYTPSDEIKSLASGQIARIEAQTRTLQNLEQELTNIRMGAGSATRFVAGLENGANKRLVGIAGSPIFGPILRIINTAVAITKRATAQIEEIEGEARNALETISNTSASFPDFNLYYSYGKTGFSGSNGYTSFYTADNPRNYYELKLEKNNKQFFIIQNAQPIDKDILKYIKDKGLDNGFNTTSPSAILQKTVFDNFLKTKGINNPSAFTQIQEQYLKNISELIYESDFFKANPVPLDTSATNAASNAPASLRGKSLSVPYVRYLDIVEEVNTQLDQICDTDNNFLDTDKLKSDLLKEFRENDCNFEEPTGDGRGRRNKLNPTEKLMSNIFVALTIRVYLYDYFIRAIFPFASLRPGSVYTDISADFFASYMESEMKALNVNYYRDFLEQAGAYFDSKYPHLVQELNRETVNIQRLNKLKLTKLIKFEIPYVSRKLGTKINKALIPNYNLTPTYPNMAEAEARRDRLKELTDNLLSITPRASTIAQTAATGALVGNLTGDALGASVGGVVGGAVGLVGGVVVGGAVGAIAGAAAGAVGAALGPTGPAALTQEEQLEYSQLLEGEFILADGKDPFRKPVTAFEILTGTTKDFFGLTSNGQFKTLTGQTILEKLEENDIEFRLMFEFCFPIRDFVSLYTAYCHLANSAVVARTTLFSGTKLELAKSFLSFTDTSGYETNKNSPAGATMDQVLGNPMFGGTSIWKFILESFIKTPLALLKSLAETGDTNVFLASLPYNITRIITLTGWNVLPFPKFPLFVATPLLGYALNFAFIIPSNFGLAYYALLLWVDWDWFRKSGYETLDNFGNDLAKNLDTSNIDACEIARANLGTLGLPGESVESGWNVYKTRKQSQIELIYAINTLDIREEF